MKMALFDNGKPDAFLLFIQNFNMTIESSGMLRAGEKIQYIHTLVRGEALHQLDMLYAEVESASPENLTSIILVLGM